MAFKGSVVAIKNSSIQQDQIPIFVSLNDETRVLKHASKADLELKLSRLKLLNRMGVMVPIKEVIVAGANITINPVTISRKNFTIRIKKSSLDDKAWADTTKNVGMDIGDNVVIGQQPTVVNLDNALVNTKQQPTVSDLMRAMKVMKLDITQIIETIKMLDKLGAINADVEIVR
jgi:flagellar basal body P-ring protein FlgI